jgi:hypothetical protein
MSKQEKEALGSDEASGDGDPRVPPLLAAGFGRSSLDELARHFHAVRLSRSRRPDLVAAGDRPLIVFHNHPSWWDPLLCLLFARQLLPRRQHYVSIDAQEIPRYRLAGSLLGVEAKGQAALSLLPVEPGTPRGARRLLDAAQAILSRPGTALWLTAGSPPSDARARPVEPHSALGHLARRLRQGVLLPLALEYPFWGEPLPEALARFGDEVSVEEAGMRAADWTEVLTANLEGAQDALAREAVTRDPACFEVLLAGKARDEGIAGLWRRLRARWGVPFPPATAGSRRLPKT